jgi:phage FluMu gp28-like protein
VARRYAAPREARAPKTPRERKLLLELYTPQDWQMEVHQCGARFRCVVCGRRAGKSFCGVNEIAAYSWEHTEYPSWWVAPTYGQAEKGFTVCTQKFESAIKSKTQAQGRMTITWKSGGKTVFNSAERYENLRGEGVGLMVLDEAAFMARAAWEQVLRPMLSDTGGRALFTTTPKGKNWVYGIFQRGEDPDQPDYASFKVPTVTSIYVPDSEVEEARNTLPADVFAQEYLADFLDEAAGVFHGVAACVYGDLYEPSNAASVVGHRYALGVDLAKHSDFTVITVMDIDALRDGVVTPHVCGFTRMNTLSWDLQMDMIAQQSALYGGAPVLIDSTGIGDPIHDFLRAKGVPCYPYLLTGTRKQQLIQNLSMSIQTKGVSFPQIPVLTQELSMYQYQISPSGSFTYGAPDNEHDDTVISLALATWASQHYPGQGTPRFIVEEDPREDMISPY